MVTIQNCLKRKGQGIVEYALLLAFVVGVGIILNSGGIKDSVVAVFEDTAVTLGAVIDYKSAVKNWGNKTKDELLQEASEKRLSIDEEALANLAGYFIGKDVNFMKGLLKDDSYAANNKVLVLGWFYGNEQGGTSFDYSDEHFETTAQGNVFNWLQGDYGSEGSYNTGYDSNTKYLFSDYALATEQDSISSQNFRKGGVKVKLKYESGTVVAAKIAIDSKNQGSAASSTHSKGLELTVTKGENGNKVEISNGFTNF